MVRAWVQLPSTGPGHEPSRGYDSRDIGYGLRL